MAYKKCNMKVTPLSERDLSRIERVDLVDFILNGLSELEKDLELSELDENIGLLWETPDRKIQVNNLVRLLNILVEECKLEPLLGKLYIDAELLFELLYKLYKTFDYDKAEFRNWMVGKHKEMPHTPTNPHEVNLMLEKIIKFLENWKTVMVNKLCIPLGNNHTRDTYNPLFEATRFNPPNILPQDYRSNFFFEAKVRELCPFTTCITMHPYTQVQASFLDKMSTAQLKKTNFEMDYTDPQSIEAADNVRGLRVHSKYGNKKLPGSYILLRAGHHRSRELFRRYLEGEISGDDKILIQIVDIKDFPYKDYLGKVQPEIEKREVVRQKLCSLADH